MRPNFTLIYVIVACVALIAALYSVLGVKWPERGAVAYVNGEPIPQAEYNRAIKAMQAGIERPLTVEDRTKAMRLLIDEELIVQDAERLGLATQDRLVRKNLVQAMIRSATSLEDSSEIEVVEARAFFDAHGNLFAIPESYFLFEARPKDGASPKAFLRALEEGAAFETAAQRAEYAVNEIASKPLPIGKVSGLLGGEVAGLVPQMTVGDIAGPVMSGGDAIFLWLVKKTGGPVAFEDAREAVETELRRRKDEAALEAYINRLRARARIKTKAAE